MSATIYHRHHIIPKHMGGSNEPSNLTGPIPILKHAERHRELYAIFGKMEDYIAWKVLSGQSTKGIKIGKNNAFYGKHHKEKTKKHLSILATKRQKRKIAYSYNWIVTFPSGHKKIINNLAKFCRDHNLNVGNLSHYGHTQDYYATKITSP